MNRGGVKFTAVTRQVKRTRVAASASLPEPFFWRQKGGKRLVSFSTREKNPRRRIKTEHMEARGERRGELGWNFAKRCGA